jgi:hypothetical protein
MSIVESCGSVSINASIDPMAYGQSAADLPFTENGCTRMRGSRRPSAASAIRGKSRSP